MADTSFVFPGVAAGDRAITGADVVWIFPGNILADDANNTTVSLGALSPNSFGLAASNFDFSSIPSGATIDGIEVQIGDYKLSDSAQIAIWVVGRLILADDTDGTENKEAELTEPIDSLQTDEMGGASDLWSETITDTDVKDVDWGCFVGADETADNPILSVDFIRMKVYYTAGAAGINPALLMKPKTGMRYH